MGRGGGGLGQFTDLSGGWEGGAWKKKKKEGVDTPMQTMQDVFGQVKELIVA